MNDERLDRLYNLLPAIYRIRDKEQGEPLRALLQVISEQVNIVEEDMARLYENWFIETCEDWVVPYIGDLVGYRPVHEAGQPGDPKTSAGAARNKILIPRREVANTIRYRRSKGTLALLEDLAKAVAGWPARAVELFKLLDWNQHLNHLHLDRAQLVDLRDGDALDLLEGPFDRSAHTVDVRRIDSQRTRGRYNIPSVGLFVWRLKSYPVTHTQGCCLEKPGPHCYTFSALGNDVQLFVKPLEGDAQQAHFPDEKDLPVPIRRRALKMDLLNAAQDPSYTSKFYGAGKSLAVWAGDWGGHARGHDPKDPIPATAVIAADLSDWRNIPANGHIVVDPVLGRIAFPTDQLPGRESRRGEHKMRGVRVSYNYGFSRDMGGGEYTRPLRQPGGAEVFKVGNIKEFVEALAGWRINGSQFEDQPPDGVIEIVESGVYVLPFHITLKAGHSLQIRAADGKRPVIRLLDYLTDLPDALFVAMGAESRFTLDGLLIAGRPVHIEAYEQENGETKPEEAAQEESASAPDDAARPVKAEIERQRAICAGEIVIRHCTLVPGWELEQDSAPRRSAEPSLELYNIRARIRIEDSIVGSIEINEDEVRTDPIPISITDSIIDATDSELEALGAVGRPFAHAVLTIRRSTFFGEVLVHAIELAENSIFTNCLSVARRQLGCMRFCYVRENCRTPRRYHCQPDLAEQAIAASLANETPKPSQGVIDAARARERYRVRPRFKSVRYARQDYARLADSCAPEIKRGADDESEMGAFHDLFNPQREVNLRARADEYTPAGMEAGIILVT